MCQACDSKDLIFSDGKNCCKGVRNEFNVGVGHYCNFQAHGFRCNYGEGNCSTNNDCSGIDN